jgi:hypothetical protein
MKEIRIKRGKCGVWELHGSYMTCGGGCRSMGARSKRCRRLGRRSASPRMEPNAGSCLEDDCSGLGGGQASAPPLVGHDGLDEGRLAVLNRRSVSGFEPMRCLQKAAAQAMPVTFRPRLETVRPHCDTGIRLYSMRCTGPKPPNG